MCEYEKLGFCDFSKLLSHNIEINVNERMINMENNVLAKSVFTFTVGNKMPKKIHLATDCIDSISKDYNNTFEELIKNVKYFKVQSSGHGTIVQIPYTIILEAIVANNQPLRNAVTACVDTAIERFRE